VQPGKAEMRNYLSGQSVMIDLQVGDPVEVRVEDGGYEGICAGHVIIGGQVMIAVDLPGPVALGETGAYTTRTLADLSACVSKGPRNLAHVDG
jgi:hypothetical protein